MKSIKTRLLSILVIAFAVSGCSKKEAELVHIQPTSTSEPIPSPTAAPVKPAASAITYDAKLARWYKVVKIEDSSVSGFKRKTYRIVVARNIKPNQVKPTVSKLLSKVTREDPELDEVAVFVYSSSKIINGPYDVASADWAPNGEWGSSTPETADSNDRSSYLITVQIKPELESFLKKKYSKQVVGGISDEKRRAFFKALAAADDRARAETDSIYPPENFTSVSDIQQSARMYEELHERYRAEERNNYSLSEDEQKAIIQEGFEKDWAID